VVITILAVFAAAVMPSLRGLSRSEEIRDFFAGARNIMQTAREKAIQDGVSRKVRYDEGQQKLVVEWTNKDTGSTEEDKGLTLPSGVTADAFRLEKNDSNSSEWTMGFYPDGKSDGGAIQFTADGLAKTIIVTATGAVTLQAGSMPDATQDEWDAGGFEQRV